MDYDKLEKMAREKGMSPFESFLRTLPVAVSAAFRQGGEIGPAAFRGTGEFLSTPDSARIAMQFPRSVEAHRNEVLEAAGDAPPSAVSAGKKVLVLFSGGPASGGNNVIVGLFKALGSRNHLYGVKAGPGGLLRGDTFEIVEKDMRRVLNTGGFDFLGSDRTKIEDLRQFDRVKQVCREQGIDALVVIGGDDSNTNAAFLAEQLFEGVHEDGRGVQVIGVPKTIDGDLQVGKLLPISFGFDTATKIYSGIVGNIAQDTPSSRKYYHFVRVMGRSASHVALAIAQRVRPSITFISEEIAERGHSLEAIVDGIADTIARRAARGIHHGVVIVPEGLIEFVPECRALISELNRVIGERKGELARMSPEEKKEAIPPLLSPSSRKTLDGFPEEYRTMLLLDRDDHGNLPVSQIETERLLMRLTADRIRRLQCEPDPADPILRKLTPPEREEFGRFRFSPISHFLGYEGRCGAPSKFDQAFTLNLGLCAGSLVLAGRTGFMASMTDLEKGGRPVAIPLSGLLNVESRGGREKIVIRKALVRLDSPAFLALKEYRKYWAAGDYFHSTGPRQYCGPKEVTDRMPITVMLDQGYESSVYDLGEEVPIFPPEG
jgi:pyrophosphate--fructose-6-phosphate 1-phosphotransferase